MEKRSGLQARRTRTPSPRSQTATAVGMMALRIALLRLNHLPSRRTAVFITSEFVHSFVAFRGSPTGRDGQEETYSPSAIDWAAEAAYVRGSARNRSGDTARRRPEKFKHAERRALARQMARGFVSERRQP